MSSDSLLWHGIMAVCTIIYISFLDNRRYAGNEHVGRHVRNDDRVRGNHRAGSNPDRSYYFRAGMNDHSLFDMRCAGEWGAAAENNVNSNFTIVTDYGGSVYDDTEPAMMKKNILSNIGAAGYRRGKY